MRKPTHWVVEYDLTDDNGDVEIVIEEHRTEAEANIRLAIVVSFANFVGIHPMFN